MARGFAGWIVCAALVLPATPAYAGARTAAEPAAAPSPERAASAETDRMALTDFDTRQRLAAHYPNELYRLYGSAAAGQGRWSDAAAHFRHAARYADKYSQHRLSLIYWHGLGLPRDRALAYAWADLAAERLYPQFVLIREKMWQELEPAERERALREGVALFDQYADAAAKPRFERAVARARSRITGTRTGLSTGKLDVYASRDGEWGGSNAIDLSPMYADWRLDSKRYWAVEDVVWQSGGNVEVGPSQTLPASGRP
ncbi:SEL1-like repeat protein [Lysobacter sp. CA199]|uniref:SEL1-like repeat protein n=1 Tax=Lysobacter sp. CA199 TaxID=3455608 RepID=UPI003F8D5ACA